MAEEKKSSSIWGCLGIGCLGLLLVFGGGGLFMYYNWRNLAAVTIEKNLSAAMEGVKIEKDEQAKIMVPVKNLLDRLKKKELTMVQISAIIKQLGNGEVFAAMAIKGFAGTHIEASALSETGKTAAYTTASRYAQGLISKKISLQDNSKVKDLIMKSNPQDPSKKLLILKKNISQEDLKKCLKIMKTAADKAGIADQKFALDIASELQKAIDKGLGTAAKQQAVKDKDIPSVEKLKIPPEKK